MSRPELVTAGVRVSVAPGIDGRQYAALCAAAGETPSPGDASPDLVIDALGDVPAENDLNPVSRGVWTCREGVLFQSVGGSGYTQLWQIPPRAAGAAPAVRVSSHWSPSAASAAAARLLPQRQRALRSQVLLHYPAMWTALAAHGMTPVHVSLVEVDGVAVLLAGPGGIGKSTLVADALAHGARAVCDNLAVSDGHTVHGLLEPMRLPRDTPAPGGAGASSRTARATHGRREHRWPGRLASACPQLVVVVRRDDRGATRVRPVSDAAAARALVGGTYAAGELQRFWPLVAHLALAGEGPVHVPLRHTAARLTGDLPCYELTLGGEPPAPSERGRLAALLATEIDAVQRELAPATVHQPEGSAL